MGSTQTSLIVFMNDLKFAFRQLLKNPGFTAVAVLTLALGIGANTAIFSVVDAVLLRPLAYPDSGQLVWLCERGPDWSGGSISYPNFIDWRNQQSVFERFGVYTGNNFTLTGAGEPVRLAGGPFSAESRWQKRDNHPGLFGLARLKPGVTLEKARADLDVVAVRLEQQYPESNKTRRVQIDRLLDMKVGNVRRALWILFGAVSFVLVIACANVANLLLARAAAREKEMALRAALGAGQWRITRQLLTESGLLALLGAAVGLIFAKGVLRVVEALAGENMPRSAEISLDPRVLLFSGLVAVFTGLLFGLAPGWHARRVDLQGTLK